MQKLLTFFGLLIILSACTSATESSQTVQNSDAIDSADDFLNQDTLPTTLNEPYQTPDQTGRNLAMVNRGATRPVDVGHAIIASLQTGHFQLLEVYLPDSAHIIQHYMERGHDTGTYAKSTYRGVADNIKKNNTQAWHRIRNQEMVNWFQPIEIDSVTTTDQSEGKVQYSFVQARLRQLNKPYTLSVRLLKIRDNWFLGEQLDLRENK